MNKTTTLVLAAIAGFGLCAQARTSTNELWNVDFAGVTVPAGGVTNLVDVPSSAFTDGTWTVAEDDESCVTNGVGLSGSLSNLLELNTQGNDLTWTPDDTGDVGNRSIVETDIRFVGADDAPEGFDAGTAQTAFYLQNLYEEESDEPTGYQLYAWTTDMDGSTNRWEAIGAPLGSTFADSWHRVQIVIDYRDDVIPYLHVAVDGTEVTGDNVVAANMTDTKTTGKVTAVSFKGTGAIDNFAGTRLNTYYESYDFTAQIYLDGDPDSTIAGASELEAADVGVADADFPDFKASFAALPLADYDIDEDLNVKVTYALSSIMVTNYVTGAEATYNFAYNPADYSVTPVGAACPAFTNNANGTFTLAPTTLGATEDSLIAKVYYRTLDAYYANEVVTVGATTVTNATFVKPSDCPADFANVYPAATNVNETAYVLSSVQVRGGAIVAFANDQATVSFSVADKLAADTTYVEATYVAGTYNAAAVDWSFDSSTGIGTFVPKTFTVAFTWHDGSSSDTYAYGDSLAAPTVDATYTEGGATYTFTGWSPEVPATVTAAGTYVAQYEMTSAPKATVIRIADGSVESFGSLAEAIAAATTGDTVKMLDNCDTGIGIGAGTNIVLDLGGYTLSNPSDCPIWPMSGTLVVSNGTIRTVLTGGGYSAVYVSGGNLTLGDELVVDATVQNPSGGQGGFGVTVANGGTVTVDGATINAREMCVFIYSQGNATVNVVDGTLTSTDNAVVGGYGTTGYGGNTINVSGGTLNASIVSAGYAACGIYAPNDDTVNISGGTINVTNGAGVVARAGSVNITGGTITTTGTTTGKVGDSRVVVPCAAVVFDSQAAYPGYDSSEASVVIDGGTFVSDVTTVQQVGDDEIVSIPSTSTAVFSDADAEGVPEGYALKETEPGSGRYTVAKTYVVTYANYDGAALQATTNFVGDATPAYAGKTPTRPSDSQYDYTFTGWSPTVAATVTEDATYVAQFSAKENGTVIVITDNGATTNYYATLPLAFAAAVDGDTVALLANQNLDERVFVNAGATPVYAGTNNRYATTSDNRSLTLDLNGHSITNSSNIALAGGSLNITGSGEIATTASGLAPVEVRGTGDLASKRTLTVGPDVTLAGGEYGLNVFGSNDAQKNVIDVTVNGSVKGTLFVLGNLKNAENEINIVVNGSVIAPAGVGDDVVVGIALNGNANVTVNDGAVVSGDSGIEVRAGNLTVNGGTITATADSYSYKANGSGSTTKGAAISVAQHTTALSMTATLNGGTLVGVEEVYVKDVNNNNLSNVGVVATESFAEDATVPEGFAWIDNGEGDYVLTKVWVVTYANYDGAALQVTTNFVGDATPAYAGKTPTRPSDSQYDYTFTGWSPTVAATVTEDATYTAQFSAKENGTVIVITDAGATTNYFATLQAALDAVKEDNLQQANIELLANASITISRNGNVLGGNSTTNITINGNNHELHVVRDGTWAQFNTANDATLVLEDVDLTSEFTGTQTGWVGDTLQNPNHNIAFNCDVELKDVDSDTALSFWKDADLDTVTIAETVDVYSIWIHTTASNIAIKDLVVNSPTGRGIKVDDSFVKYAGAPSASTAISIDGASFTTKNKKSAVLVRSAYPVAITTAGTIDISNVPADTQHLVWVDEDASEKFGLVTLDGGQSDIGIEGGASSYAASLTTNAWIAGYYKVLADAVEVATAADKLDLLATSAETFTVSKALTITRNGYSAEGVTAGEGYERTDTAETYVFAEKSAEEEHEGAKDGDGFVILAPEDTANPEHQPLTFTSIEGGTATISAKMLNPNDSTSVQLQVVYRTSLTGSNLYLPATVSAIDDENGTATVTWTQPNVDTFFLIGLANKANVED